ncbi:MAG: prepilin-type N-terminal cleavage/methylation domain-containing protein [Armatimonadetes bacterium]|nr:prepilin-type N-terminal cleavage/methylation domain-containing protein [Armatimonadota bacterium]
MNRGRRGFSFVEVVMAILLLSVGLVGVVGAFGKLAASEIHTHEKEQMTRLAVQKLEELLATGQLTGQNVNGDFSDIGDTTHTWTASDTTTSTTDLNMATITVSRSDDPSGATAQVSLPHYVPPTTVTTTSGGTP